MYQKFKEEEIYEVFVKISLNRKERSCLSHLKYSILPSIQAKACGRSPLCQFCVNEIEVEKYILYSVTLSIKI